MPPRDEQDFEQRRQQIIDGALHIFAEKGFERATNKDIAEAAQIGSPGLIYHYFRDKEDLFYQVMEQRIPLMQILDHPEQFLDLPLRDALTLFARRLLAAVNHRPAIAIYKLLLSEAARRPAVAAMLNRFGPGRALPLLSRYFELQMEHGVMRRMDPSIAARAFVGPFIAYLATRELFAQPDAQAIPAEQMIAEAVELFLRGTAP